MSQQLLLESSLLLAVIGAYEWRLRCIVNKVSSVPCRDEVERLIDLKLEVFKSRYDDLRDDIHRLEKKIDLLIAKNLKT